jgi:hypothetical protein
MLVQMMTQMLQMRLVVRRQTGPPPSILVRYECQVMMTLMTMTMAWSPFAVAPQIENKTGAWRLPQRLEQSTISGAAVVVVGDDHNHVLSAANVALALAVVHAHACLDYHYALVE